MKPRTCSACDNPAADGVTICGRCEKETRRRLGDMEAHRHQLEVTMTRQTRLHAAQEGGRSANTPLAYDETASTLLGAQRAILASWSKLVHDEISNTWPNRETVRAMALFIEAHLPELRKHQAAGELVHELRDLITDIIACVDYPEDRHKSHVGPCIIVLEDGSQCPGQINLHLPTEGKTYARCTSCNTRWEGHQLNRLGQRILQQGVA